MDKISRDKITLLEERVKVLQQQLLKHVASSHYFSGHQGEVIDQLEKRLAIREFNIPLEGANP